MNDNPMWIVVAGGALTGGAMLLFLYSLWLGLNRQRWWLCGVVCGLWLLAMAGYAAWDASARDNRRRPADAGLPGQVSQRAAGIDNTLWERL